MRFRIVKMHYRSWRTCRALAVQDLGKRLEYFSQKHLLLYSSPGWRQSTKIAPRVLRTTVSMTFEVAIVSTTLIEISSADRQHIYQWLQCCRIPDSSLFMISRKWTLSCDPYGQPTSSLFQVISRCIRAFKPNGTASDPLPGDCSE
jgi:hypothetical protein